MCDTETDEENEIGRDMKRETSDRVITFKPTIKKHNYMCFVIIVKELRMLNVLDWWPFRYSKHRLVEHSGRDSACLLQNVCEKEEETNIQNNSTLKKD